MIIKNKKFLAGLVIFAAAAAAFIWFLAGTGKKTDSTSAKTTGRQAAASPEDAKNTQADLVKKEIVVKPDIDYKNLDRDEALEKLMDSRKKDLGIQKSLDMIVTSEESFTVGDQKVSMRDILEKAFIQKGEVFEETIEQSGEVLPGRIKQYGIYVVQPGDNIWNIHFNLLKEFYDNKGINISPKADEPVEKGMSSGVGKILKFSEKMVTIYNLAENKVSADINLLKPLSKVVIYNMDEVFSLLKEVNYENIDRIQFDGKTIWIPARKK